MTTRDERWERVLAAADRMPPFYSPEARGLLVDYVNALADFLLSDVVPRTRKRREMAEGIRTLKVALAQPETFASLDEQSYQKVLTAFSLQGIAS